MQKFFKSKNNGNFGIQIEISFTKYLNKIKNYTIWEDPNEDFDFVEICDNEKYPDYKDGFSSLFDAIIFLQKNFGKLEEIKD